MTTLDPAAVERVRRDLNLSTEYRKADGRVADRIMVLVGRADLECLLSTLAPAPGMEGLREALEIARSTFTRYANLHFAKATSEGDDKGRTNMALARRMAEALSRPEPVAPCAGARNAE